MRNTAILFLIALSISMLHIPSVYPVGVGVNPSALDYSITSLEVVTHSIYVINTGDSRTLYELYFDNQYQIMFSFNTNEFELEPDQNRQVSVSYNPLNNPTKEDLDIDLYIKGTPVEESILETGIKLPVKVTHDLDGTSPADNGHSFPLSTSDPEITNALQYLSNIQTSDGDIGGFSISQWATMAIASTGQSPHEWKKNGNSIVEYLKNNSNNIDGNKVTDIAKFILAMTAANEDPRNINGINYVSMLEDKVNNNQFGDESMFNDDFWSILALISADVDPTSTNIQNAVSFIKNHQNSDGGWSWISGESDVDNTAMAIISLIAAGEDTGSSAISNAFNYLKSQLAENGGFAFMGDPNSASDSWGIMALVAADIDPTSSDWIRNGASPVDNLLSLQNSDGSFNWTVNQDGSAWMTSYAIPALIGKTYPISPEETIEQVYIRIEDVNTTVWRGWIEIPHSVIVEAYNSGKNYSLDGDNVLAILDRASNLGSFTYQVSDQWYPDAGFYVDSITGHNAEGLYGWLYRVNYAIGNVAMNNYNIRDSDEILIYWGTMGVRPLKIEVNPIEVAVDEPFTVTATYLDDSSGVWIPLEGAIVHVNDNYVTDSEGKVIISLSESKVYDIYAEKWGETSEEQFVRSDIAQVGVGVPIPEFNTLTPIILSIALSTLFIIFRKKRNELSHYGN